jgi:DNA modification methylase
MTLTPDPDNPNRMAPADKARMAKSLAEFGDLSGVILNRRTGLLVGGHQRTEVLDGAVIEATDLPEREADGTVARGFLIRDGRRYSLRVVDWTPRKAKAALLAANRFGRVGTDDADALARCLREVQADSGFDMDLTGYADNALAELIGPAGDADAEPQLDRAEELRVKWGVQTGDLWLIGDHRLLCGDSTSEADVGRLLGGAVPLLMVTDPPYGVEYDAGWRAEAGVNKNKGKMGKVSNDDIADWSPAWSLFTGDAAYVYHADVMSSTVQTSLEVCKFKIRAQIIWAKDRMALSRGDYHWQHEPCWYAVRDGRTGHRTDDRKQTTLWEIPARDDSGHGHSTQKPVECMARPMRNHVAPEVYDPFLGSGTTMVAAQNLSRKCYGLEIAPGYVAVILQRMADAFPGIEIRRQA